MQVCASASMLKPRITLQASVGGTPVLGSVKAQASAWWSGFFGDQTEVSWTEFASKVCRADVLGAARLLLMTAGIVGGRRDMLQPAVCLERWIVFVLGFRNGAGPIVPGRDPSDALDFERAESLFQDQLFHGFIGGTEAITKLSGRAPGTCLFRFTTSPSATSKGRLTLSFVNPKSEVIHLVIGHHVAGEQTVGFCNRHDLAACAEDAQHNFFYDANAPGKAPPFDIPVYPTLADLLGAVEEKYGFALDFHSDGQYVS